MIALAGCRAGTGLCFHTRLTKQSAATHQPLLQITPSLPLSLFSSDLRWRPLTWKISGGSEPPKASLALTWHANSANIEPITRLWSTGCGGALGWLLAKVSCWKKLKRIKGWWVKVVSTHAHLRLCFYNSHQLTELEEIQMPTNPSKQEKKTTVKLEVI